jgi:tryptophan-rich sensory protein
MDLIFKILFLKINYLMRVFKLIILFAFTNFSALFLGSLLMGQGASSSWYMNLDRAYWEPEGWVFGVAWVTIMICFSIYLALLVNKTFKNNMDLNFRNLLIKIYSSHLVLNILWNYLFFNRKMIEIALIDIVFLTILLFYFLIKYFRMMKYKSILILPYCMWLIIATSLNMYIVIYN